MLNSSLFLFSFVCICADSNASAYSIIHAENCISGDDGYVAPPVPIPNTVVKHINAESTWLETAWEDRKLPVRAREVTAR